MLRARCLLSGRWGMAVGACFIYFLSYFFVFIGYQFFKWFLLGFFIKQIGWVIFKFLDFYLSFLFFTFFLNFSYQKRCSLISLLFFGESFQYLLKVNGCSSALAFIWFLFRVFCLFWGLVIFKFCLFIVPGFLALLSYSMVFFVIADQPALGAWDVLKRSEALMIGHRWRFSCLVGRFLGWWFLCFLSLGIGCMWLVPYKLVSIVQFYDDLKSGEK